MCFRVLGIAASLAASVLLALPAVVTGQQTTGFLDRSLTLDGRLYPYQVYLPRDYDPGRRWPVILFLHGAGERGDDGRIQAEVGLGSAVRRHPARYPAIVIFPQAPADATWQDGPADAAMAALDRTLEEFSADAARVYITGLSMGGAGTWYLAYRHPERFSALLVVCPWVEARGGWPAVVPEGPGTPYDRLAGRVKDLPIWILHGEEDPVLPVEESRRMAAALEALGADIRYTELPGMGHGIWDAAYRSPAVAEWLMAQRR